MTYSIEKIKAMLGAATDVGDWYQNKWDILIFGDSKHQVAHAGYLPNAELIAAAPTIIKELLEELERRK